ncbi:MAG: transposase [Nitrosopumilaceae archaeon]|nr:transposase [Nitrosopumilaceae archaeon]
MDEQSTKAKGGPGSPEYKDLSLPDLLDMFPDDQAAMEWLEGNVWPDGRKCPRCGYGYTCTTKHPSMPYYCSECDRRFSVKIGTVMEHSKISYRSWAIATYLLATRPKGISSTRLGRDLGISQSSAWFLLHRLRGVWRTLAGPDLMAGAR